MFLWKLAQRLLCLCALMMPLLSAMDPVPPVGPGTGEAERESDSDASDPWAYHRVAQEFMFLHGRELLSGDVPDLSSQVYEALLRYADLLSMQSRLGLLDDFSPEDLAAELEALRHQQGGALALVERIDALAIAAAGTSAPPDGGGAAGAPSSPVADSLSATSSTDCANPPTKNCCWVDSKGAHKEQKTKTECDALNGVWDCSVIQFTTMEHIQASTDWSLGSGAQGSACGSCTAGLGAMPSEDLGMQITLSRRHRYRLDMPASFGHGVFAWWDMRVRLHRWDESEPGVGGQTTLSLIDPFRTYAPQRFQPGSGMVWRENYEGSGLTIALDRDPDAVDSHPALPGVDLSLYEDRYLLQALDGRCYEFEPIRLKAPHIDQESGLIDNRPDAARFTALVDRFGNRIEISYRLANLPQEELLVVKRPDGSQQTYRDWPIGFDRTQLTQVATVRDPHGTRFTVSYEGYEGGGSSVQRVARVAIAPADVAVRFLYDAQGYLHRVERPDGTQTAITFDEAPDGNHRVVTIDDPACVDNHRRKAIWLSNSVWTDPEDPDHFVVQSANQVRRVYNGAGELKFHIWFDHSDQAQSQGAVDFFVFEGGSKLRRLRVGVHDGLRESAYHQSYDPQAAFVPDWQVERTTTFQRGHLIDTVTDALGRTKESRLLPEVSAVEGHDYPDGSQTGGTYNEWYLPLRTQARDGTTSTYAYNGWGALIQKTEAYGTPAARITHYVRSRPDDAQPQALSGLLLQKSEALGRVTDYEYNAQGRLSAIIEAADVAGDPRPVTKFTYDQAGRLQTKTLPDGQVQRYHYDPAGRTTRIDYRANGTDSEYFHYYGAGIHAGLLWRHVDRVGSVTEKTYDADCRLIREVLSDAQGNQLRETLISYVVGTDLVASRQVDGEMTTYEYDGQDRLVRQTRHATAETTLTTSRLRDEVGRVYLEFDPYGRARATRYDINDRPQRRVQALSDAELDPATVLAAWQEHAQSQEATPQPLTGIEIEQDWDIHGSVSPLEEGYLINATGHRLIYELENCYLFGRETSGQVSLSARMSGYTGGGQRAQAGLMLRADASVYAAHVFWGLTPGGQLQAVLRRGRHGHPTILHFETPAEQPLDAIWLRIDRIGQDVYLYYGEGPDNPILAGRYQLGLPVDSVLAGLVVTSDEESEEAEAYFTDLRLADVPVLPSLAALYRWYLDHLDRSSAEGLLITDSTYDKRGRLLLQVDPRGITTRYAYDALGQRLAQIEALDMPEERRTEWEYDAAGNPVEIRHPRFFSEGIQALTRTIYNGRNRPLAIIQAAGSPEETTELFTYTGNGKKKTHTDGRGFTTTYHYGTCCDRLTGIEDPTGAVESLGYDDAGRVTHRIDQLNQVTRTIYDGRGRPVQIIDPLGNRTRYVYDENLIDGQGLDAQFAAEIADLGFGPGADGSAVLIVDPTGARRVQIKDGLGRTRRSIDPARRVTTMVYDEMADGLLATRTIDNSGRITSRLSDGAGRTRVHIDAAGQRSHLFYDANGNRIRQRDPVGIGEDAVYDALNRVVETLYTRGSQRRMTYDAADNRTATIDAEGARATAVFDTLNRKTRDRDRIGAETLFAYDANSNLTLIRDAEGGETAYVYDPRNLLIEETFPGDTGGTRVYTYDPARRLATRLDQAEVLTTYQYDAANRLTSRSYSTGAADHFAYDAAGRLTEAQSGRYANTVARAYDSAGQLAEESLHIDGVTLPIAYGYDNDGRIAEMTHPDGVIDARSYDERGLLEQVSLAGQVLSQRQYDAAGRLVHNRLGNGLSEQRRYLPDAHLVESISVPAVTGFRYRYDAENRKTKEFDDLDRDYDQHFYYDAEGRLTRWRRAGKSNDLTQRQRWDLTPVGDWARTRIDNQAWQEREHTPVHELVAIDGVPLEYDAKGNLTDDDAGQHLAWDEENRLLRTVNEDTFATYAYDALGRRVRKTVGSKTTTWLSAGAQEIVEIEGSLAAYLAGTIRASTPADRASVHSTEGGRTWEDQLLAGLLPNATVKINLQPASSPLIGDWLADHGQPYGPRLADPEAGALTYGWLTDLADNSEPSPAPGLVDRNHLQNGLLDTTALLESGTDPSAPRAAWQIALAPGAYTIAIIAGDAMNREHRNNLYCNDQILTDDDGYGGYDAATAYATGDFDIYITSVDIGPDGLLRLGAAADAISPRLIALAIEPGAWPAARVDRLQSRANTFADRASQATGTAGQAELPIVRRYAYGSYVDERIVMTDGPLAEGNVYFYHTNHLYSVAAISDANAQVVERYNYDAYGQRSVDDVDADGRLIGNSYGFTGRRFDVETGLWYFRARYYDAEQGRFVGRDPLGYADGYGLYGAYYVPTALDPYGKATWSKAPNIQIPAVSGVDPVIINAIQNLLNNIRIEVRDPGHNPNNPCQRSSGEDCTCCKLNFSPTPKLMGMSRNGSITVAGVGVGYSVTVTLADWSQNDVCNSDADCKDDYLGGVIVDVDVELTIGPANFSIATQQVDFGDLTCPGDSSGSGGGGSEGTGSGGGTVAPEEPSAEPNPPDYDGDGNVTTEERRRWVREWNERKHGPPGN